MHGELSCESGQSVLGTASVCDVGNGGCRPGAHKDIVTPDQVTLDPNKRYYISILPGDAADPGHGMGGAQIGAGQKTVNVMVPDTTLGDRLNQFDLRFSRIFRIAANSLDANIDIYNAFNSDAALGYTAAYSGVNGGSWVRPTSIIQGRIVKFGIRWDF